MGAKSSFNAIAEMVAGAKAGEIFFPDDFTTMGTPDAIRSALTRLCRDGKLCRMAKGIYYVPMYDKWDGSLRQSSLDTVAQRIAERDNARIAPTGVYALNRLGLSTQVPANIVYLTDGSARRIKFGDDRGITFRHSNELDNFAYHSQIMQLAVMAMREIGQSSISEEEIDRIKGLLRKCVSESEFNHDIVLAPIWVKKILQRCNL